MLLHHVLTKSAKITFLSERCHSAIYFKVEEAQSLTPVGIRTRDRLLSFALPPELDQLAERMLTGLRPTAFVQQNEMSWVNQPAATSP